MILTELRDIAKKYTYHFKTFEYYPNVCLMNPFKPHDCPFLCCNIIDSSGTRSAFLLSKL